MGYFAEINPATGEVTGTPSNPGRGVIVAPSLAWCVQTYGGTWAETCDPYVDDGDVRVYCGPGYKHDAGVVEQFVSDEWTVDKGTQMQPDGDGGFFWFYNTEGMLTWHNGRAWRNLMPTGNPNVWEPGVANWREYPMGVEHPVWIQPTGAVDAYPLGFVVEHNGAPWRSEIAANVWEPGAVGSESLWSDLTPAPPALPDAWVAGTYPAGAEVTHNGSVWEAAVETSEEPGTGSDWFVTGSAG